MTRSCKNLLSTILLIPALLTLASLARADEVIPTNAEIWKVLQEQRDLIDAQRKEIEVLNQKLEATGDIVERVEQQADYASTNHPFAKTTIGGYGELHYNNLNNQRAGGENKDEMDFHRFVLFFGHEFSEDIRLFSELELEHSISGDDQNGEVELEQAYIEFDLNEQYSTKAGLFLMPVGILNETHEPTTFYGVERNPVEKNIVPTTWWEGGALLNAKVGNGFTFDLAATSGLKTDDYSVRGGRQKVSKADASDFAFTGRALWRGLPGVELGLTGQFQENIAEDGMDRTQATLFEAHTVLRKGPYGLRALYARWDLNSDG
ncbi:MAG: porin, partial [Deltaproteobacteria bacterium]|nr:porin [Deltaproteobacteria bacterium]